MSTEKNANYTSAMVERLHDVYDRDASETERAEQIEALSVELNRTVKSVRAKLVREGVYVKKAYVSKAGSAPERKEAIVQAIATALEVDADTALSGLEKATKGCLQTLRAAITG